MILGGVKDSVERGKSADEVDLSMSSSDIQYGIKPPFLTLWGF